MSRAIIVARLAGEVARLDARARFEDEHVEARLGERARDRRAAGAAPDHDRRPRAAVSATRPLRTGS